MDYKPGDIFVGIIDFFAILLPGALLSFAYADFASEQVFGKVLPQIPQDKSAVVATVFVFSSYVLGHFAFYLGALLDDYFYDPVRRVIFKEDNPLLHAALRIKEALLKEEPSYMLTQPSLNKLIDDLPSVKKRWERYWSRWRSFKRTIRKVIKPIYFWRLFNDDVKIVELLEPLQKNRVQEKKRLVQDVSLCLFEEEVLPDRAQPTKYKFLDDLGIDSPPASTEEEEEKAYNFQKALLDNTAIQIMNTFQWAKAYVELKAPGTAVEIHRYEANSKFFRSLIIVLFAIIPVVFSNALQIHKSLSAALSFTLLIIAFIFGGCLIYVDQRRKAIRAAYQYFIILVKTDVKPETMATHS